MLNEGDFERHGGLGGRCRQFDGFRTEAEHEGACIFRRDLRDDVARQANLSVAVDGVFALDLPLAEVHGRGADEACDEGVGGRTVHFVRGADLLEQAVLEHRDAVAHGQSFGLIVGHVDGGDAQVTLECGDLGTGLYTELGVQVGQRFVHEEHLGFADDCAAHGDALTLATGERLGLAVEVGGQIEDLGRFFNALANNVLGFASDLEGEAHVVCNGHVRVQSVVLEDHRDVAILGGDVGDVAVANEDAARVDIFEACEHAERG